MKSRQRNIVFDLVGVLMRFDTEGYYRAHGIPAEDRALLQREVFRSLEWALQDRGAITESEAAEATRARLPSRLHAAAGDFVSRQNRAILPVAGMEGLLKELKDMGYHLFLLSNTTTAFHRFRAQVPGMQYFEDTLISADVGLVKPDPEIFRLACRKFGIEPKETAFIDDTPINAEAAHFVGMRAFVFNDDVEELRKWLGLFR